MFHGSPWSCDFLQHHPALDTNSAIAVCGICRNCGFADLMLSYGNPQKFLRICGIADLRFSNFAKSLVIRVCAHGKTLKNEFPCVSTKYLLDLRCRPSGQGARFQGGRSLPFRGSRLLLGGTSNARLCGGSSLSRTRSKTLRGYPAPV